MGFLLHHSIEGSAEKDPDRDAFRFDGAGLSYQELVRRADQLASVLIEEGVRPGDRVGIYMHKALELPVALYGILKAGAAYVPIDPAAPLPRIRFIIEDCGLRHLMTGTSRARRTMELVEGTPGVRTVIGAGGSTPGCRFITWPEVETADARPPRVRVTEQDLAYIMYTSGSTGAPKGLMHTHASGLSYATRSAATYDVRAEDRLGNHSPLHFDMSTFEYLTGPLCGATSVIISEETTMFPVSLGELIERERLTFWYSVPLALIQLFDGGDIERRDAQSLRWVLFGGEPFAPKYLRALMTLWPHARFSNVYGPAEVNQCTYYHVPNVPSAALSAVPIGKVWDNAEGLVVDADDQAVAPGEPGELLIRTPTMMNGYWARPDLNAAAFFDQEPFPGFRKRFYRTGDLVREGEDGNLLFLGRKDRQIKIRGYRVELDEVEHVVGSCDEVAEAAAISIRRDDGQVEIVAAVLLRQGCRPQPEDIRARAAERLPPYAVPGRVDVLASFPRTGSGKIDRRALAASYGVGGSG
ncbi:MAG: amino acid adenylation domain-containing protein [Acidobacteriota bacterium]